MREKKSLEESVGIYLHDVIGHLILRLTTLDREVSSYVIKVHGGTHGGPPVPRIVFPNMENPRSSPS